MLRDTWGKAPVVGGLISPRPVVAVVRFGGIIGSVGPLRPGINLAALASVIDRAFSLRRLRAVALSINSPGGSAVQAALLHRRIRALAEEKEIPVLAFAEDVAASGGYWLACAADEIFADENSIIGSVGVIYAGFGFHNLIHRVGIERRIHKKGDRKLLLDPFQPEKADEVARLEAIQSDVHDSFKDLVRARRGDRLKGSGETVFSGEFWTGRRALELGLIDGLGDLRSVMRERYGERVKLRPVGGDRLWLPRRFRPERGQLAFAEAAAGVFSVLEERAMWGRYGL